MLEAKWQNILVEREKGLSVGYKEISLPHSYFVDFIFFNKIIVEIKAVDKEICDEHVAQTLNYLKASGCRVGLIINFGRKSLEYRRLIF